MICRIGNSLVVETHLVKLLGIQIDSKLKFETRIETVCKKASQKLNALSKLVSFIPFHKRKILMQAYFYAQFSYSPLVWMFHSRRINTRINNLHFRALRIVYLIDPLSKGLVSAILGSWNLGPLINNYLFSISLL